MYTTGSNFKFQFKKKTLGNGLPLLVTHVLRLKSINMAITVIKLM